MKVNEGTIDRALRVVAGLALIAWVTLFGGPVWAWIGVVPLATGALGNCPLYSLIGINTCPVKNSGESA
ncbi:MAG: DUF2892 domain-containing protein [Rhodocyclaceae bacterium]|nr:MAG: DUF2892 domain-containing protein [Rhodocyclaceae bacterium]